MYFERSYNGITYCEKILSNSKEILNLRWEHLYIIEKNSAYSTNKFLITLYNSLKQIRNLK